VDDDARALADERRRLLHELEVERNQLIRNIETCRIRDIDRPFIGDWSLRDIVGHVSSWEASRFRISAKSDAPSLRLRQRQADEWNRDYAERKRPQQRHAPAHVALLGDRTSDYDSPDASRALSSGPSSPDREHWHAARLRACPAPALRARPVVEDATPA
jgi:hypothetical protein